MKRILALAEIVWLDVIRRKDAYVLLILLTALLTALLSVGSFGLEGVTRYVKDVGFLMAWLFGWILAVTTGSRQLPGEERAGTIYPLLAKPITRLDLILGKWLGAWSAIAVAVLCFYLLVAAIARLHGGETDATALAQAYALHAGALAILTALAILISTCLNADAALTMTFVCSAAAFWVVPRVPSYAETAPAVSAAALQFLYHVLPHFEVLDMRQRLVHDYGPLDGASFALSLGYAAAFTGLLLTAAWAVYRRRRFTRGAVP
jgi:ABC-type transport system involved in multi-copper enzyme maturation permease subunit